MKNILGIDGSKSGWVGVKQSSKQEGTLEILFNNKLIDFLSPDIDLIIIDMPVGLDRNIQQGGRLVDKEARNYFKDKVYKTVIPRNVRLSEAPSHGLPCVIYDKSCSGSKSYFRLADEFLEKKISDEPYRD